jgi:hypothetical protein
LGGAFDLFHHKPPVCSITDIEPAKRDNRDLIGAAKSVPVSEDGPGSCPKTIFSALWQPKSLIYKYFSYKSFKLNDFAGISANSMIPLAGGEGGYPILMG